MVIIIVDSTLEVVRFVTQVSGELPVGMTAYEIPDEYVDQIVARIGHITPDGALMVTPGTILTQPQLDKLVALQADKELRAEKVQDEILALIGMNVLDLTDAQRWKLVAAVFYKLGVISAAGVIQPYADWSDAA